MGRLTLMLLLTASLSASYAASVVVLMDSSNCVHLRCEWRGVGKHCKPATSFRQANQQKTLSDGTPLNYPPCSDDESDTSIFARIQARYPVNTFTLVNDLVLGEQCERRRLWCNSAWISIADVNDDFSLKIPSSRVFSVQPRLHC